MTKSEAGTRSMESGVGRGGRRGVAEADAEGPRPTRGGRGRCEQRERSTQAEADAKLAESRGRDGFVSGRGEAASRSLSSGSMVSKKFGAEARAAREQEVRSRGGAEAGSKGSLLPMSERPQLTGRKRKREIERGRERGVACHHHNCSTLLFLVTHQLVWQPCGREKERERKGGGAWKKKEQTWNGKCSSSPIVISLMTLRNSESTRRRVRRVGSRPWIRAVDGFVAARSRVVDNEMGASLDVSEKGSRAGGSRI